jgi:hypothetical protein
MKEAAEIIGIIGIWILIFWVPFQIKRLNQTIAAQAKLIANFESQSGYLSNVQETMSRLYDPKEIEAIVMAKLEAAANEQAQKHKDNIKSVLNVTVKMYADDVSSLLLFASLSSIYLSKDVLESLLNDFKEFGGKDELANMIRVAHEKHQRMRTEALVEALRSRGNEPET